MTEKKIISQTLKNNTTEIKARKGLNWFAYETEKKRKSKMDENAVKMPFLSSLSLLFNRIEWRAFKIYSNSK